MQKIIADYYAGERFINVLPVDLAATTEGMVSTMWKPTTTPTGSISPSSATMSACCVVARLDNLGRCAMAPQPCGL